jgi:hypothetical protein
MKKTVILFVFLVANAAFAQQWTAGTNLLYTTSPVVSIGASTIQGQYGNPPTVKALEIVSQPTEGSFINLKSGTKQIFLGSSQYGNNLTISANDPFAFGYGATNVMKVNPITTGNPTGSLSIGTNLAPNGYKLAVGGKIIAEELKIQLQTAPWPDYVFAKDYQLPTLAEVEKQIQEKGHLANVPSACEVEANGFEVGDMARIQQQKIEELTLYIIELNKKLEAQDKKMQALEAKINN